MVLDFIVFLKNKNNRFALNLCFDVFLSFFFKKEVKKTLLRLNKMYNMIKSGNTFK